MINLLPVYEKEKLHHEYHFRLAAVGLFFLLILLFIANVMLIPSYILSSVKLSITKEQSQDLKDSAVGKQKEQYEEVASQTNDRVHFLLRKNDFVPVTDYVSKITSLSGENISLTGILFQSGKSDAIQINGVAKNRSELIAFQERLKQSGNFSDVVLPVSSLVSDENISFSMNLTLKT